MNVTEFQEDLRAGMTIDAALKKHGLTFKEAMETLHGYGRAVSRPKKGPYLCTLIGKENVLKLKGKEGEKPYIMVLTKHLKMLSE